MSLASFTGLLPSAQRPHHETLAIQNLKGMSEMSSNYNAEQKKKEEERNKPPTAPKNELVGGEESALSTLLSHKTATVAQAAEEATTKTLAVAALVKDSLREMRLERERALALANQKEDRLKLLALTQSSPLPQVTSDSNPVGQEQKVSLPEKHFEEKLIVTFNDNNNNNNNNKEEEVPYTGMTVEEIKTAAEDENMESYLQNVLQDLKVFAQCMRCHGQRRMLDTVLCAPKRGSKRTLCVGKCSDCDGKLSRYAPKEVTQAKKSKLANKTPSS